MDKTSEEYQARLDICNDRSNGITRLLEIMKRLRDKDNGCAWDLEQNYQSLVSHVIEEAYEVVEAIESNNVNSLKEELGDLLFGIVFLSHLAGEDKHFNFYSVVDVIADKMIRRHPHVFADNEDIKTVKDQIINWENIKKIEQKHQDSNHSDSLKNSRLPALHLAKKWYQSVNPELNEREELKANIGEVINIMSKLSPAKSKDSRYINFLLMGEILYNMIKISRCISVDPEAALKNAIKTRIDRTSVATN